MLPSADHAAEVARLQHWNERLRMARDILKKSIAILELGDEILLHRRLPPDYPVTILCDVLGVSPAGYYTWRSRPESERSTADRDIVDDIRRVHRDTCGR
jgi:hypothetical protein